MQQYAKMHNAIELLELTLPRQLFQQLSAILDFLIDSKKTVKGKTASPFIAIATSILSNATQFNNWTKSLTWWLASREEGTPILPQLAAFPDESRSQILKETKEFVIFAHNHNSY